MKGQSQPKKPEPESTDKPKQRKNEKQSQKREERPAAAQPEGQPPGKAETRLPELVDPGHDFDGFGVKGAVFFGFPSLFFWAAVLRFGFVYLNESLDIQTDVDYHVYTEGAAELLGPAGNPYRRYTYRYTPLVAYMMVPNLQLPCFGKLLFNLFDLAAIYYMHLFLQTVRGVSRLAKGKALAFWALNPFMVYINGRGSCESVSLFFLAAMLFHLRKAHLGHAELLHVALAGLAYGLLVHFRLYPVIFALSLYLYVNKERLLPRLNALVFGLVSLGVNAGLLLAFYRRFGEIFLEECFLYHLKRKDPRHNYSIFWISTVFDYFEQAEGWSMMNSGKLLLGVRLGLICLVALAYRRNHLMAMFIQTFVFTTLNTVYTAQYAVWETQLLPYLLLDSQCLGGNKKAGFWGLLLLWFLNLEAWTYFSGKFEHQGENSLYWMHLANLGYFLVRILFLNHFVESRKGTVAY